MKVHKLILNGKADDGARLDDFCERLASAEFAAGARLRALAWSLPGGRSWKWQRSRMRMSRWNWKSSWPVAGSVSR